MTRENTLPVSKEYENKNDSNSNKTELSYKDIKEAWEEEIYTSADIENVIG